MGEVLERRDVLQARVVDQHLDGPRERGGIGGQLTLASEVTSSAMASAEPPAARMRSATAWPSASLRSHTTTW